MRKFFSTFHKNIPEGVRLVSVATGFRWFGWGCVEAFIPIFLFSFSNSYAETGALRSIYALTFLLSLPVVSWFADHIPSKKLLIAALIIYPLISLIYFFAGATGVVIFVVIARALNGVAYALDCVGRSTYIRTHTEGKYLASSFGYLESVGNFWWVVAVFLSAFTIGYIPVHYLFLAIIPTALIALLFIARAPNGIAVFKPKQLTEFHLLKSYRDFFSIIVSWGSRVRWLALLLFFVGVIGTIGDFFLPIYSYTQHGSLWQVVGLTGFAALPYLFSAPLGRLADRFKGVMVVACMSVTVVLTLLALTQNFFIWLVLVFALGLCLQLLALAIDKEVTGYVLRDQIGRLSGALHGVSQLSEIAGPISLGIIADMFGVPTALFILSGFLLLIGCGYAIKTTPFFANR